MCGNKVNLEFSMEEKSITLTPLEDNCLNRSDSPVTFSKVE